MDLNDVILHIQNDFIFFNKRENRRRKIFKILFCNENVFEKLVILKSNAKDINKFNEVLDLPENTDMLLFADYSTIDELAAFKRKLKIKRILYEPQ